MDTGDDEPHALEAALDQASEEGGAESFRFGGTDLQADDLATSLRVAGHSDYGGDGDDAAALVLAEVDGVEPEIGPVVAERAIEESADTLVDAFAALGGRGLRDPRQTGDGRGAR